MAAAIYQNFDWDFSEKYTTFKYYLDRGSSGSVFGPIEWIGGQLAIKQVAYADGKVTERFKKDLEVKKEIWISLEHKHLTRIHAVDLSQLPKAMVIVMEYAPGGSLNKALRLLGSENKLPIDVVTDWANQIAGGMLYLHERNIVHRDLKSSNILLMDVFDVGNPEKTNTLKITDFNEVKQHDHTTTMSFVGTCAYMAPEVLLHETFSKGSDVWSFGVLVWEMLSGDIPHKDLEPSAIVYRAIEGKLALSLEQSFPEAYKSILKRCWKSAWSQRPTFDEIVCIQQRMAVGKNVTEMRKCKRNVYLQYIPDAPKGFCSTEKIFTGVQHLVHLTCSAVSISASFAGFSLKRKVIMNALAFVFCASFLVLRCCYEPTGLNRKKYKLTSFMVFILCLTTAVCVMEYLASTLTWNTSVFLGLSLSLYIIIILVYSLVLAVVFRICSRCYRECCTCGRSGEYVVPLNEPEIRALTILHKEIFIARQQQPVIEIYDSTNFQLKHRMAVDGMTTPINMVSCTVNNCLYTVDSRYRKHLHAILRIDPINGKMVKAWYVVGGCRIQLSVAKDTNLIICPYRQAYLDECTSDMQLIRTIKLGRAPDRRITRRIEATHAAKLESNLFVVCQFYPSAVYLLSTKKAPSTSEKIYEVEILKRFSEESGGMIESCWWPMYLSVDNEGSILVAFHDRVMLLSPNLDTLRFLISMEHGMASPESTCFDESTGKWLVTDGRRIIACWVENGTVEREIHDLFIQKKY